MSCLLKGNLNLQPSRYLTAALFLLAHLASIVLTFFGNTFCTLFSKISLGTPFKSLNFLYVNLQLWISWTAMFRSNYTELENLSYFCVFSTLSKITPHNKLIPDLLGANFVLYDLAQKINKNEKFHLECQ